MDHLTLVNLFKIVKKGPQSDFCDQCPREAVNLRSENGDSLLIKALRKRRWGIVSYLLDCGADVTPQNHAGNTALHVAVCVADVEQCRRLVELGALVNARNVVGMTPLMRAAMLGRAAVVELLLELGADTQAVDSFGRSAALVAQLRGHDQMVSLLAEHDAPLAEELRDKVCRFRAAHQVPLRDFSHPFAQAVREGNRLLLSFFHELGMHFGEGEDENLVALALEKDDASMLEFLLSHGCILDDPAGAFRRSLETQGRNVAFYVAKNYPQLASELLADALSQGEPALVEVLFKATEREAPCQDAAAVLLPAVESGDEAKVRLVLEHGASFAACAEQHSRMFELVAAQDNLPLFELMLQHGCVCDIPAVLGRILAAKQLHIARFLEKNDLLDLKALRRPLELALIEACHDGQLELVRLLLQMGVDVNATDAADRTPFNQALKRGLFYESINICCWGEWRRQVQDFRDILTLLRDRGATLHAVEKHAKLPSKFHQQLLCKSMQLHRGLSHTQLIEDRALAQELLHRLPQTMTWI